MTMGSEVWQTDNDLWNTIKLSQIFSNQTALTLGRDLGILLQGSQSQSKEPGKGELSALPSVMIAQSGLH